MVGNLERRPRTRKVCELVSRLSRKQLQPQGFAGSSPVPSAMTKKCRFFARCGNMKEDTQIERGAEFCIECEVALLTTPGWAERLVEQINEWSDQRDRLR